jgi:hypothetical protein
MPTWMRTALGVLLTLAGLVWFFQGLNMLPGTFMRGSTLWVVIGLLVALVGLNMLGVFRRKTGR